MAADRKMRNPTAKLIHFEKDEIEAFENSLPRNVSLAEALRAFVKEDNKKNEKPCTDFSALANAGKDRYDMTINQDLRSYLERIRPINDIQELREINLTGQEITKITGQKLGQLLKKDDNTSNRLLSFSYDREQLRESHNATR